MWAVLKAAAAGDRVGQFRLAWAYQYGEAGVSATKKACKSPIMAICVDCVAFGQSYEHCLSSWHDDRHRSKLTFISALRIC